MAERTIIPARFNGPPGLGHGGYSCGVVAAEVGAPVAAVSLRKPPPLDVELEVRRGEDGAVAVLDADGGLVAEGAPARLDLEPPAPVELAAAEAAEPMMGVADHPFPTCFGCGPLRDRAEAIRVMIGPVEGRSDVMADAWTPLPEFGDADGHVTPLFTWAALDCPTGWGGVPPGTPPHVLARLTADPSIAPIRAGEPHVVLGWLIEVDGRKRRGGSAIYTAGGEPCAAAEGLWIELRDPRTHGAQT